MKKQSRLSNGRARTDIGSFLPPNVAFTLRQIAQSESVSLSWVIAEIVCDYFKIDHNTGLVQKNGHKK